MWKFSRLVPTLQAIEHANTSRDFKKNQFSTLLDDWKREFGRDSLFDLIRLLLPNKDLERKYGLQEANLGPVIVQVLGLDIQTAGPLLAWKADSESQQFREDFSSTALQFIELRSTVTESESTLTIHQLNNKLDELSKVSGRNAQSAIMEYFFKHCTALEQKWIIRIILKNMRLGISDETLMQCIHPNAPEIHHYRNNLRQVIEECNKIQAGEQPLTKLSLFCCFQPMKLRRALPEGLPKLMHNQPFFIEEKLDGHRVQLHKCGDQFRYYNRHGQDNTSDYGSNKNESLSKRIYPHLLKRPEVKNLILDGEMMSWDPLRKVHLPLRDLRTTIKNEDGIMSNPASPRLCFVVFDILLINDRDVTQLPLRNRRKWLSEIVEDTEGTIKILPFDEVTTDEEVVERIETVLQNRGEGLVVKDPASLYLPGARIGTWLKIKPDYISHLGEHLDMVIVGVEKGQGNRSHLFSSFTCAIRMDVDNATEPPSDPLQTRWGTVSRVGTGFTEEMLINLYHRLESHLMAADSAFPAWLVANKHGSARPDYWICPWNSVVVQVKASELSESELSGSTFSMRFPRFVKIRDDKAWWDCSTLRDVRQLYQDTKGIKMHLITKDEREFGFNAAAVTLEKHKGLDLVSHQKVADLSNVSVLADIFKGIEICVITGNDGDKRMSKAELEKSVAEMGGRVVAMPKPDRTKFVVVGRQNVKSRPYTSAKEPKYDVVTPQWIVDCREKQRWVSLKPKYVLNATAETEKEMRENLDKFGDSYTELVSEEQLVQILDDIEMTEIEMLDSRKCRDFLIENNITDLGPSGFMFPLVVLFDKGHEVISDEMEQETEDVDDKFELEKIMFTIYGGIIAESEQDPDLTHIVIANDSDGSRELYYHNKFKSSARKPDIVSAKWIQECLNQKTILEESDFKL